jgi:selenocysteine-specific elongation factor
MEVIVGTAGHIDHGKTALVGALTGIDTDRLPEEKSRGITIDLGFAEMSVGDTHFAFIDVPGHERFVRNMLAGASGIDLVLLVVAADEGVMPQTREHFEICRLLGLEHGVIALTKSDLVDQETLDLATDEVKELVAGSLLEGAAILSVSSRKGEGIEGLQSELVAAAARVRSRTSKSVTFLPIDRRFSIKGFGTVVTGTLVSGEIAEGDGLVLLPTGKRVRVRGLQSHGRNERHVTAGRRAAVNLAGIDTHEISRGEVLTVSDALAPTQLLDCELQMIDGSKPLRSRQRVRIHLGTAEVLARVQVLNAAYEIAAGDTDLVQLRLETPVAALPGQRFIVRSYSPETTIGGGVVIDIDPAKHRRRDIDSARSLLQELIAGRGDVERWLTVLVDSTKHGLSVEALRRRTGLDNKVLELALKETVTTNALVNAKDRYIATDSFLAIKQRIMSGVEDFHASQPLERGMPRDGVSRAVGRPPAEILDAALSSLAASGMTVVEGDIVRIASYSAELSADEEKVMNRLLAAYGANVLDVPRLDEALVDAANGTDLGTAAVRKLFQRLVSAGRIVKATEEFFFSNEAIDGVIRQLQAYADATTDRLIDVPTFKELVGVSRKYAIPLLEYLDGKRITRRAGDKRVIL